MVGRNEGVPEDKRVVYRIGVHIGDVLIDGDDILGDGVNVASRLEGICEPGGVCVSTAVHEQVQGHIAAEFSPQEPVIGALASGTGHRRAPECPRG